MRVTSLQKHEVSVNVKSKGRKTTHVWVNKYSKGETKELRAPKKQTKTKQKNNSRVQQYPLYQNPKKEKPKYIKDEIPAVKGKSLWKSDPTTKYKQ